MLTPNLDHARDVRSPVSQVEQPTAFVVVEYLKNMQKENLSVVNEALNELLVDDEDSPGAR